MAVQWNPLEPISEVICDIAEKLLNAEENAGLKKAGNPFHRNWLAHAAAL